MRQCGACQLCCKLLPVKAVNKPGGVRCKHQKFGVGCAIYRELPRVSPECRLWNCGWLVDEAGALGRPDHSHIVIDILPDQVIATDDDTGEKTIIPAVQVWIDPKHRDAHRDPALRAYLQERGQRDGACAIIRYGEAEGFMLFPPALTGGTWREQHIAPIERKDLNAMVRALGRQPTEAEEKPGEKPGSEFLR